MFNLSLCSVPLSVGSPVSFTFQPKLYKTVMEDVINEVRELFLDEGVDEQVLMELKTVSEISYCKQ